jgi:hypothetical protein
LAISIASASPPAVEIEQEEGEEAPYTIEAHGAVANAMPTGEITPQDARAAAQERRKRRKTVARSQQP